jgi:hypothetical protein
VSPSVLFATLLLSSVFAAEATAQTVSFEARRDFSVGSFPRAGALDDFNGDGVADMAVLSTTVVSVMLGNGDATFEAPVDYAPDPAPSWTPRPESIAVADFNGDGALDLALANWGTHNVGVLLGNGDGTFQTAVTYPTGSYPASVASSDFNGDDLLDLVVSNHFSNNISVLDGQGDGTFGTARDFAVAENPDSVVVGDFNGDGMRDLAVAIRTSNGVISVLPGNGDGTFQPAQDYAAGPYPQFLLVDDFNGDGAADFAFGTDGLELMLGNGDGTFQTAVKYPTGAPQAIASSDFNGDGVRDLAVAGYFDRVSVLLGNGDATFQTGSTLTTGGLPHDVEIGDLNGDGRLDLVSVNSTGPSVSVLVGHDDGTFVQAPVFAAGTAPSSVVAGDFNGDRLLDLAVANRGSNDVSVLQGGGDGTFQSALTFPAGVNPRSLAAGDFNHDAILDLAVANNSSHNVSVLLGNGDGTFQAAGTYASGGNFSSSIAVGDLNRDGILDLAVANAGRVMLPTPDRGNVSALLGNGDGTFQTARTFAASFFPSSVAIGDLNRDGVPDLAAASTRSGSASILLGNGDGTFGAANTFVAGPAPSPVKVTDVNGDAVLDLVVANTRSPNGYVSLFLGNGDGTFAPPQKIASSNEPWSVAVDDINGDGVADLTVVHHGDGVAANTVAVMIGHGDATFDAALLFGADQDPVSVAVGDVNGDGKVDLAVTNAASNNVSVLINNTPTYDLTVSREGNGSGTVTSTSIPTGATQIDCGTVCTATYYGGTQVTLTAYADVGSTFAGWTGCDTVSATTCTVTMSEAKSVAATFTLQQFALTITKEGIGRGTVTSSSDPASSTQIDCGTTCSASFDWGTVVTLTATPAFANRFMGWSGCDSAYGSTCVVTIHAGTSVTARFVGLPLELGPSANPASARNPSLR